MRPVVTEAVTFVWRCGKCKKAIRRDWNWCAHCGERVDNPPLAEMRTELSVNDEA